MNNDRTITISVGESRKSVNWKPQTMTVSQLYDRLSSAVRSTETMDAYLRMPKGRQDELKDIGGFVAGTLSGPRRKAGAVVGRDVITLDLDSIPKDGAQAIVDRLDFLGFGYCVYSTRKHRPSAPRLRVIIPLDRTATADEYEACARRTAEWIGIEAADPTTFEPHRLMYWGSCCADAEWFFRRSDGPLLPVDDTLATYADWTDTASWPRVEGEATPERLARHQADPESKMGIVGAFCRTYDIVDAMEAYIPGVYSPAGEGRYTFEGGSTTGGAVLYDQEKFLFSHHATDPCSGQLVNAWDMVRIHKFGHLDDSAEDGTRGGRLPSYLAMVDLAAQDDRVSGLLAQERFAEAQAAFRVIGDDEAEPMPEVPATMLTLNANGRPEKSLINYRATLEYDPSLAGKIQLNVFSGRIEVNGRVPWIRPGATNIWGDDDASQLRLYFEHIFGKVPKADILDAVAATASDHAYHPVRDYLDGLVWDGVPRLDTMLIDYLGAEDSEYTRAVTRKAFTAAVARIYDPGCKYDTMVVLVGKQGRHKSSILAKMGGEWFSDSLRSFGDKDSMETIQGTWVNELAEMQALNRAEVEAVKGFLSKTSDLFRAAYGRYTQDRPRQCVFFGTTNTHDCLTDITGGRRFWIIDIDQQERTKNVFTDLDSERDQLWAEALAFYHQHEPLHLDHEVETVAREIQNDHRVRHPWEELITSWLDEPVPEKWNTYDENQRQVFYGGGLVSGETTIKRTHVCPVEIWTEAIGRRKGDMKRSDAKEIGAILDALPGWERTATSVRMGRPYGVQRGYVREGADE